MFNENLLVRINKIVIMIILGTFILAELLYIPLEYKWGLQQVCELVTTILKRVM
jgi:hypothetical protein